MPLRLFNTLNGRKEEFVPAQEGNVSLYVCGVTPYDNPHLGHARAYITFDTLKRHLLRRGYEVYHVQNFTDIDDKIIRRAAEEGVGADVLAQRYIDAYYEDMDALGILRASVYPRVTEHIEDVVAMVASLEEKGFAYQVDGDVYFDVSRFSGYGRLSGRSTDEAMAGARVEVDERKRNPLDFALWKSSRPGEPSWESPWGAGRPGWHIECSAMAIRYLGCGFDIHGGGQDLIFPHHENEIAQSEAYSGCSPFARYWVHNGFVTINREKMSKSLGNFFTVREIMEHYEAEVLRYYLISVHYRSPLDFSDQRLEEAGRALARLRQTRDALARRLEGVTPSGEADAACMEKFAACRAAFDEAMDDDCNTAEALAALHGYAGEANRLLADEDMVRSPGAPATLQAVLDGLHHLGDALGILRAETGISGLSEELMKLLIDLRGELRGRKLWDMADYLRDRLGDIGITLEDRPEGTTWRKA